MISLIIVTYNRDRDLKYCLDSVVIQNTKPYEVIVVDNACRDETRSIVDSFRPVLNLKYIQNLDNSLTIGRNIGIANTSKDTTIVSFIDDDCTLDPFYYFSELNKAFKTFDAVGITGKNQYRTYTNTPLKKIISAYIRFFQVSSFLQKGPGKMLPSMCVTYPDEIEPIQSEWLSGTSSFRKDIFDYIQYDHNLKKYSWNEDLDFSYRLNKIHPGKLWVYPKVKYWHKGTDISRMPSKEIAYMAEVYDLYLFSKNMPKSFYTWFCFYRSRVAGVILRSALSFIRRERGCHNYICALIYSLYHFRKITRGDISDFNRWLS